MTSPTEESRTGSASAAATAPGAPVSARARATIAGATSNPTTGIPSSVSARTDSPVPQATSTAVPGRRVPSARRTVRPWWYGRPAA